MLAPGTRPMVISTCNKLQEQELSLQLDNWLNSAIAPLGSSTEIRAIIAPHAGYDYSAQTAAFAYKSIDSTLIKKIFIFGPSHKIYFTGCALSACTHYKTPRGNISIDSSTIQSLHASNLFNFMNLKVDEDEHSIEMHLPFVEKLMHGKEFSIIPVLVGTLSLAELDAFGNIFSEYLSDPSCLFVISSDFCHWGSRFQYIPHALDALPIHESIKALDHEAFKSIENLDLDAFVEYLKHTKNTICGRYPIQILLKSLQILKYGDKRIALRFNHYSQSNKVLEKHESSVSYASAQVFI